MLQESPAEGVHVRVGVLDLADSAQDAGDGVQAGAGEVADVVFLDVAVGEALQVQEAGVDLAQDGVAVAGNHLPLGKSLAYVLLDDLLVGSGAFVVVLELDEPLEALLVGEPVEGAG